MATVLVGRWTGELDRARLDRVLGGAEPFDERTMTDDADGPELSPAPATGTSRTSVAAIG